MKINEKYTAEQKKALETAIMIYALMNVENAPTTQEAFDAWCEQYLAEEAARVAKKAADKAKRDAREAAPGYKAHKNWKRCETEIQKAKEEIARLMEKVEYYEARKAEYAETYKTETGNEIEG